MYLRKVVRGKRLYWDLVEGHRDPHSGKVRQRVIAHLGRDEHLRPHLPGLVQALAKLAQSPLIDPRQVAPEAARDFGGIGLLDHLWRQLGLDRVLSEAIGDQHARACFAIVCNRILVPTSTPAAGGWLERAAAPDGGEWGLESHHLQLAMDALADVREQVEERVYWLLNDTLRLELTLVFVDLTSIHVEGAGPSPLWQHRASSDSRGRNTRLLLASSSLPTATRSPTSCSPAAGPRRGPCWRCWWSFVGASGSSAA